MKRTEIFISLQGEGYKAGTPTIFYRLAGCNFAMQNHPCLYCDTKYSQQYQESQGILQTPQQAAKEINELQLVSGIKDVCITGGEPLCHLEIEELIERLDNDYLSIETNGSLEIWPIYGSWSLDVKLPSSGNDKYNLKSNWLKLTHRDQVKFVISDIADYREAMKIVREVPFNTPHIYFQPAWQTMPTEKLARQMVQDCLQKPKAKLGGQWHKYWFPNAERGV